MINESDVKKCPICGRLFISNPRWMYRRNSKWYCRYNCYRAGGGDNWKDTNLTKREGDNENDY